MTGKPPENRSTLHICGGLRYSIISLVAWFKYVRLSEINSGSSIKDYCLYMLMLLLLVYACRLRLPPYVGSLIYQFMRTSDGELQACHLMTSPRETPRSNPTSLFTLGSLINENAC